MLPLKKIYIDSRDRTVDSKRASNFKIELPSTVQMPDNGHLICYGRLRASRLEDD